MTHDPDAAAEARFDLAHESGASFADCARGKARDDDRCGTCRYWVRQVRPFVRLCDVWAEEQRCTGPACQHYERFCPGSVLGRRGPSK